MEEEELIKAVVENKNQIDVLKNIDKVSKIILSIDCFSNKQIEKYVKELKNKKKKVGVRLERISRYEEIKNLRKATDEILNIEGIDEILVENLDQYAYLLRRIKYLRNIRIELDYTMNIYNKSAKEVYDELLYDAIKNNTNESFDKKNYYVAPIELNKYELKELSFDTIIVYGFIPTMVSSNCLRKNTYEESCKNQFNENNVEIYTSHIVDRQGKNIYYRTYCKYCYNKIFNVCPIYLLDLNEIDDIKKNDNINIRYDFTIETEKEIEDIIVKNIRPKNFTRGHFINTIK